MRLVRREPGVAAIRPWAPLLLLAALILGAVFHEWHHLRDPGCGAENGAHCWCASLHASARPVPATPAPQPALLPAPTPAVAADVNVDPEPCAFRATRAPPQG